MSGMTWARIECRCEEDGDCLIWTASVDKNGFPRFHVREDGKSKTYQVRRLAWELKSKKPVPPGKKVTSTCGNRLCLAHLGLITHSEMMSKVANRPADRARRVANGLKARSQAKLDMEKARYIRESDKSATALAKELGISIRQACRVRNGQAWREYRNPFAGLGA